MARHEEYMNSLAAAWKGCRIVGCTDYVQTSGEDPWIGRDYVSKKCAGKWKTFRMIWGL